MLFGIGGHVDHVPAHLLEPLRLRARREARALDDDDGAAAPSLDPELAGGLDQEPSQIRAVGIGGGDMGRLRPVVERVLAAARSVYKLVADHELAPLELRLER